MRIGLYPGSFDPITNGHLDVIGRAVKLVDRLFVCVAENHGKNPLFPLAERTKMVAGLVGHIGGGTEIVVRSFNTLLMRCVEECGASVIFRGLRAVSDFEYEFQMVLMNQKLNADVETVFLMADPEYQAISSRLVKEVATLGGPVSDFVPAVVARRLHERLGASHKKEGS